MNRVKARSETAPPASKRCITSRVVIEFGLLLSWKQTTAKDAVAETADDATKLIASTAIETNCENFRISNNGSFPAVIDFKFGSSLTEIVFLSTVSKCTHLQLSQVLASD